MTNESQSINQTTSGTENVIPPQENMIQTILQHKKLVLFFILGLITLLSVITASISSQQTPSNQTPIIVPPTPADEVFPTKAQSTTPTNGLPEPTGTAEEIEIQTQTRPQLDTVIESEYNISITKIYPGDWANILVYEENNFDAAVVAKKENGVWKVLLGPGTYFTSDELREIGAPQELINDLSTE